MIKICLICKKEFNAYIPRLKYCSRICYQKARIKHPERYCKICGKIYKPRTRSQKYCSKKCNGLADRNKDSICIGCGKPFRNSHVKQKYCNLGCYLQNVNHNMTRIEQELYDYLNGLGIIYEKQYYLKFTVPDAFIPELNLCIYADGIYWHNIKKNKKRDVRQNKKLFELDYKVIRLSEQRDLSLDLKPLIKLIDSYNDC